jgi:heptosyltransferase-2
MYLIIEGRNNHQRWRFHEHTLIPAAEQFKFIAQQQHKMEAYMEILASNPIMKRVAPKHAYRRPTTEHTATYGPAGHAFTYNTFSLTVPPKSTIAVLMPDRMGDFIFALSVVMQKYSGADPVTLLVPEKIGPLAEVISPFEMILYRRKNNREYLDTIQVVKERRFSKIYLLQRTFSAAQLAFRCEIPHRRGIQDELRPELLTDLLPRSSERRSHHLTKEYAEILETPFIPPQQHVPASPRFSRLQYFRNVIVLSSDIPYWASNSIMWCALLPDRLPQLEFVMLGYNADQQHIKQHIPNTPNIRNLTGKTTIAEATAIVASSALVVSGDSGLLHLAGFFGTPAVGIYGPTSAVLTCPLGKDSYTISTGIPCSPCFNKECPEPDMKCITGLSLDRIIEKVITAIASRKSNLTAPSTVSTGIGIGRNVDYAAVTSSGE